MIPRENPTLRAHRTALRQSSNPRFVAARGRWRERFRAKIRPCARTEPRYFNRRIRAS